MAPRVNWLGSKTMADRRQHVHRNPLSRFASAATAWTGSTPAFVSAAAIILIWIVTGPLFHFSDTWQLVINTGTTIVTFLMVFLIQNTQNRDTRALHLKLDELLRALPEAREHEFMDLEDRDEGELKAERVKLFEECGVCRTPEEHAKHAVEIKTQARH
ncbi:MAG TPA: low affinity iron permease family protein, partial [Thermoanaerobaculia bacterium]|nr:low affinity iron permease family protein [Thermoanaerobaculia bacterium]